MTLPGEFCHLLSVSHGVSSFSKYHSINCFHSSIWGSLSISSSFYIYIQKHMHLQLTLVTVPKHSLFSFYYNQLRVSTLTFPIHCLNFKKSEFDAVIQPNLFVLKGPVRFKGIFINALLRIFFSFGFFILLSPRVYCV